MLPAYAREWIFGVEGDYGDDPDDSGGPTKYGISQKAYPELDIKNLTRDQAVEIYAKDYWRPIRGDELPRSLGVALFDSAVNQGVRSAVMKFQLSLNALGLGPLTSDGLVGPKTIHSAHLAASLGLELVMAEVLSFRSVSYIQLVMEHPKQMKFFRGWMRRLFRLQMYCMGLA